MRYILIAVLLILGVNALGQATTATNVVENSKTNTIIYKGKAVTVFSSTAKPKWRFTHNGVTIVSMPFFTGGHTASIYKIDECDNFDALTNRVRELNLKLDATQQEEMDSLTAEYATKPKEVAVEK